MLVVNAQHQIEKRDVTLGIQTARADQILSGVQQGELVVVGNQGRYQAGETIRPVMTDLAIGQGEP